MNNNDDFFTNFDKFMKNSLPKALTDAMDKAVLKVESDSRHNCPVDDGVLRASINSEVENNKDEVIGYVGSNCNYAPYVHQGTGLYAKNGLGRKQVPWVYKGDKGEWHRTKGQKPNPFIKEAIDKNEAYIQNCFKNII